MTAQELVELIASKNPITPFKYDGINTCEFCDSDWAEDTFKEYVTNDSNINRLGHHDKDCLWVLANEVVRSE